MPFYEHDDLKLFYREQGSGPLLLILPGNTASSACHTAELEYFAKCFHAVSPDFRGTGQSERLPVWTREWWQHCADDLAALLSHLGEEKCFVMGTSGGANIALLFAIRHPELVQGVIADSCAEVYPQDQLRREVEIREQRNSDQVDFWQKANGDDWESVIQADSKLLLDLAEHGGDVFHGSLKEVRCPVLLTGSLHDSFLPHLGSQQIHMAEQIRECSLLQHDDGDHPFMWTCPADFRAVADQYLGKWLERCETVH